ncbi:hypothetical protein AJ80_06312 [Polytolypa hystricis UAMH7299]|uniref:Cell surface protein n=1 Tax=Polytolypa hystricis (strain UAMH7299) TaxID=1447883 RepID=A0A2B7XXD2_POLH7|nr:hypothetical protein AJ80_06312 [Polytolypa hystricis UAMH7299]
MSNVAHKIKDAVTGRKHDTVENTSSTGTTGHSTNAGPHSSNIANKVDPRVDSDRDHRGNAGVAGTHTSRTTNVSDPRVQSDMNHQSTGTNPVTGNTTYGAAGDGTGYTSTGTNVGPHDSRTANKLDPRVDSDYNTRGTTTGYGASGARGTAGSGTVGSGTIGSAPIGSGTASRTAGPHDTNFANQTDPRVDSDLDGSRTYGGNATHNSSSSPYGTTTTTTTKKDPSDAAQVPPSVMAKAIGLPLVEHDDPTHDRARRHSAKPGDSLRDYSGGS